MLIGIPVDDKKTGSAVCSSFGRAAYFLIYDTLTQETELLDNHAAASQGGAGIKAAQLVADHGVKAILVPRCGQNAREVLQAAEMRLYQSIPGSAQENIDAYAMEKLIELSEFHPGFHGHGN